MLSISHGCNIVYMYFNLTLCIKHAHCSHAARQCKCLLPRVNVPRMIECSIYHTGVILYYMLIVLIQSGNNFCCLCNSYIIISHRYNIVYTCFNLTLYIES